MKAKMIGGKVITHTYQEWENNKFSLLLQFPKRQISQLSWICKIKPQMHVFWRQDKLNMGILMGIKEIYIPCVFHEWRCVPHLMHLATI